MSYLEILILESNLEWVTILLLSEILAVDQVSFSILLAEYGLFIGSQMNVAILNGSARGFQISSSQPSTSRGENSQPAAETHNECITMWEPVHLKQEWTVSFFDHGGVNFYLYP